MFAGTKGLEWVLGNFKLKFLTAFSGLVVLATDKDWEIVFRGSREMEDVVAYRSKTLSVAKVLVKTKLNAK